MVPPQMMGAELRTYCRAKNSTSLSAGSFSGAHMLQDRPANVPGQTRLWTRGLPSFVAKLREFGREVTCAAARSKHACRRQTRGRELLGGAPPPRPVATDLAYARQVDSGRLGRTSTQSSRQNRGQSVRTCDGRSVIGQRVADLDRAPRAIARVLDRHADRDLEKASFVSDAWSRSASTGRGSCEPAMFVHIHCTYW